MLNNLLKDLREIKESVKPIFVLNCKTEEKERFHRNGQLNVNNIIFIFYLKCSELKLLSIKRSSYRECAIEFGKKNPTFKFNNPYLFDNNPNDLLIARELIDIIYFFVHGYNDQLYYEFLSALGFKEPIKTKRMLDYFLVNKKKNQNKI